MSKDEKKVPYAFSKKQPGVTDFSVDKKTNSFIIKGKIPYHKDGEAELTGNYTQTVTLTPDNKIRIKLEYTRPEAAEKGFLAMIAEIPQAKTYETAGKNQEFPEKKWVSLRKEKSVKVDTAFAEDSFILTTLIRKMAYVIPKGLHIGSAESKKEPQVRAVEIELDLLNWSGKARSGAVDLFEADALKTETSPSANLVPNPYFARGLNYIGGYWNFKLWRGMKVSLSKENPKFG